MSKPEEELDDVKDDKKKKKEKSTIQTKVIIRRLPVGLNKTQFLELFEPLPEYDFFRYVMGDRSLAPNNFSRAYINFVNVEDIIAFRDKYDGSEVETQSGQKSTCLIEYAPFQKVTKKGRKKEDPKVNTIEKDADFIKFLETLEEQEEKQTIDIEKFLEELDMRDQQNKKPVETPLTTFVKQRREERKRLREERRKQDAERRKKKDEERRKKREAERRRKVELEKSKRKEKSEGEIDGKKKTLGETKREMQENNRSRRDSETNDESGSKIKLLQKKDGEDGSKSKDFKQGVYTADELEKSWVDDYIVEWPDLSQNDEIDGKPVNQPKEARQRPPPRDYPSRKWKDDHQRPLSGRNKDQDAKEDKFKNKKPDREIYYPGTGRGSRGGYRGGRGSRPHKYSEQRNRKPGENDK